MPPSDLMTRLRIETRAPHDQIESVPFHQALAQGELHRDDYHTLLEVLLMIHGTQEELRDSSSEQVRDIAAPLLRLCSYLEEDLKDARTLGTHPASLAPRLQTAAYLESLRQAVTDTPPVLLGHLYVLHGSLLGGLQLRPLFLKALQWSPEKMRYFGGLGPQVPAAWRLFRETMNNASLASSQHDQIVAAATNAFEHLITIYDAFPDRGSLAAPIQAAS